MVVSSMIGTGVLTISGFAVHFVGGNQVMLALWLVGGLLAACGVLTPRELSAAPPRSGGDYLFLREAYGPLAASLSGWVSFLIGFGGPIAASAKHLLAPFRLDESTAALAQPPGRPGGGGPRGRLGRRANMDGRPAFTTAPVVTMPSSLVYISYADPRATGGIVLPRRPAIPSSTRGGGNGFEISSSLWTGRVGAQLPWNGRSDERVRAGR